MGRPFCGRPIKTVVQSAQMPGPVEPVSQLRREQLRALMAATWWRGAMLLVPIAAGAGVIALLPDSNRAVAFIAVAVVVALVGLIATYILADARAKSAFVQAWARSRGWTRDTGVWVDEATPLLRDGDRRESGDHVSGQLAPGGEAALCHYTYEVRHESTDSNGHTSTSWEAHDFTVVETVVEAPDIPSLTLHRRTLGDNRLFDRIDSALTSDRVEHLESSELERAYKLEVADSCSEVAVRLLFEPAFIVWCLDQAGDGMLVELENETLVVAIPDHSYDAAELDGLVDKATMIATRFADARASMVKA
jgi:hypothetical protein